MRDDLRRMALIGSGVAELTKNRAEQLARDLLERSKQNRDDLMRLVSAEIRSQLDGLGLASKRDVERLERRVARLEARLRESGTNTKPVSKRSTVKGAQQKRSTTTAPSPSKDAGEPTS